MISNERRQSILDLIRSKATADVIAQLLDVPIEVVQRQIKRAKRSGTINKKCRGSEDEFRIRCAAGPIDDADEAELNEEVKRRAALVRSTWTETRRLQALGHSFREEEFTVPTVDDLTHKQHKRSPSND